MIRFFTPLLFLAVLVPHTASAVPVRISANVLFVGSYDSDLHGFGTIVDDFDLGTVHAGLSGVLLDVTTIDDSGNSRIKVESSSRWNIYQDKGSIQYTFSSSVAFHFSTGGSLSGPFTGNDVIFDDGELLSFSGDPGSFTFFNPDPVDPDLVVGSNFVQNVSTSPGVDDQIRQGLSYGSTTGLTTLMMTHDDLTTGCGGGGCEGGFNPSGDWHAWVDVAEPVDGPSTFILLTLGLFAVFRQKKAAA